MVLYQDKPNKLVNYTVRLYSQLSDEPLKNFGPLQLFKLFIDKFGVNFRIGTFEGKLLYSETLNIRKGNLNHLVDFVQPPGSNILNSFHMKFVDETTLKIALAYIVDRSKYLKWIENNVIN